MRKILRNKDRHIKKRLSESPLEFGGFIMGRKKNCYGFLGVTSSDLTEKLHTFDRKLMLGQHQTQKNIGHNTVNANYSFFSTRKQSASS